MIEAVIIEDDEENVRILRALLDQVSVPVHCCGHAATAKQGELLIRECAPQLVFLDISLRGENAFDILDRMMPVEFEVIFITAYDGYMLKALRYSALDYLLKPVNIDELSAAIRRAAEKIRRNIFNGQLANLLFNLKKPQDDQHRRIALPVLDRFDFVDVNDIVRCEADSNYTHVFINSKQKYVCAKTLHEYSQLLPEAIFVRVHHAHLVNINFIKKFHKDGRSGYIELLDGNMIEVSSRRKESFLARFC